MAKRVDREIIKKLREEVLRKQRNANAKVSRLRKQGVSISFTGHDPRTNAKKIARYTTSQLIAYSKRLDEFTSRSNQFVAGAKGTPIPKAKFNEYKRLESLHNRKGAERMEQRGNLKVPGSGLTVAEREALGMGIKKAHGDAANKPFFNIERTPTGIVDIDALIKDMRKKLDRRYLPNVIKARRNEVEQMMTQIGTHELQKQINELSDYQFDIMVHESDFMRAASLSYELEKMKAASSQQEMIANQYSDALNDLKDYIKWAKSLPRVAE